MKRVNKLFEVGETIAYDLWYSTVICTAKCYLHDKCSDVAATSEPNDYY